MYNTFIHIIYIRFNYNKLDDFKKRLPIFKKYCLSSLLNQTCKNFKAYININEKHKYLLEEFTKNDIIILTTKSIKNVVKKHKNQIMLSTRLDSDDSINIYFIETLQKNIKNIKKLIDIYKTIVLDFKYGYQLNNILMN